MPRLLSIQVGRPRIYAPPGAARYSSAIHKQPVEGPVRLSRTNFAGDRQADLENHGGPDKAVLAYDAGHYTAWRAELDRPDLQHGAFGENLTIEGLTEATVCLGDVVRLGSALLQVSQPRMPCFKLADRLGGDEKVGLIRRVNQTCRTGWYLRVLEEGEIEAGMPIERIERPHADWPITRCSAAYLNRRRNPAEAAALAAIPVLAADWQEKLLAAVADSPAS